MKTRSVKTGMGERSLIFFFYLWSGAKKNLNPFIFPLFSQSLASGELEKKKEKKGKREREREKKKLGEGGQGWGKVGFSRMKGRDCGVLSAGLIVPRCAVATTSGAAGDAGPLCRGERSLGRGHRGPSRGDSPRCLGGRESQGWGRRRRRRMEVGPGPSSQALGSGKASWRPSASLPGWVRRRRRALRRPPSGGEDIGIAIGRRRDPSVPVPRPNPGSSVQALRVWGEIQGEFDLWRSFGAKKGPAGQVDPEPCSRVLGIARAMGG